MGTGKIQKRVDLSGRSPLELEHRVQTLERAISDQNGIVIAVRRAGARDWPEIHRATIYYALPDLMANGTKHQPHGSSRTMKVAEP